MLLWLVAMPMLFNTTMIMMLEAVLAVIDVCFSASCFREFLICRVRVGCVTPNFHESVQQVSMPHASRSLHAEIMDG